MNCDNVTLQIYKIAHLTLNVMEQHIKLPEGTYRKNRPPRLTWVQRTRLRMVYFRIYWNWMVNELFLQNKLLVIFTVHLKKLQNAGHFTRSHHLQTG